MTAQALSDLQSWFATSVTQPGGVANPALAENKLRSGPSLSAVECLQIYNDGYFARLIECLSDDYPALSSALGPERFSRLAREYIEQRPSTGRSLNAYGQHLPDFCRGRAEPWAAFASDLSHLEWALVEVVHAAAPGGLAGDALARIPPAAWHTARFIPSPALRVLTFEHPVGEYLRQYLDGAAPEIPASRRSATAVCRQGLTLWRVELTLDAASLLEELVAGQPLGAALARLEQRTRQPAALLEALPVWLRTWVSSGFFAAIES
ncbi:MAG: DNA-binding domain-containing protein [Myxococcota bacterium]|nr:DNA-binding domain-containing protein [Myxococcota bacterium]